MTLDRLLVSPSSARDSLAAAGKRGAHFRTGTAWPVEDAGVKPRMRTNLESLEIGTAFVATPD